jgi:hypothetical protein
MATFKEKQAMIDGSDTLALGSLDVHRMGFGTMQLTGPGV